VGVAAAQAVGSELEAVIPALHRVADMLTEVKRGESMRASVTDGRDCAASIPKHQHVLIENRTGQQRFRADLIRPCGDIPSIAKCSHHNLLSRA
jgi:hypothetical protein